MQPLPMKIRKKEKFTMHSTDELPDMEELYDMDDDALYDAFKAAKAEDYDDETEFLGDVDDVESVEDTPVEDFTDSGTPAEAGTVGKVFDETTQEVLNTADKKRTYRANGIEYEFTEEEIFNQFGSVFGQAMDYTKKMQKIKPYRSMVEMIEANGISETDLALAIDALKGDKDAIASVVKKHDIDMFDINYDEASQYTPKTKAKSSTELEIAEVISGIQSEPEYATTYDILQNRWDDASRVTFADNPIMIKQLHHDVKTGVYDKVSAVANKLKVFDGGAKTDLAYYLQAGAQVLSPKVPQAKAMPAPATPAVHEVNAAAQKRVTEQQMVDKRRAAAPTKTMAGAKTVTDYLNSSDEDYDAWYARVSNSR